MLANVLVMIFNTSINVILLLLPEAGVEGSKTDMMLVEMIQLNYILVYNMVILVKCYWACENRHIWTQNLFSQFCTLTFCNYTVMSLKFLYYIDKSP